MHFYRNKIAAEHFIESWDTSSKSLFWGELCKPFYREWAWTGLQIQGHVSRAKQLLQPQATESVEKLCFLGFQTTCWFFGVFLALARPSEAWCFPAGRWCVRSCFTASRRQQNLSKMCFSKILARMRRLLRYATRLFFSVQRLHGFRQVVCRTVWHCMSSNCKLVFQAIYCWGPQKWTGEGPVHSPLGRHHHKPGKQQRHTKQNQTKHKTKQQKQNKPKPNTQEWLAPSSLVDSCRWWQLCVITS